MTGFVTAALMASAINAQHVENDSYTPAFAAMIASLPAINPDAMLCPARVGWFICKLIADDPDDCGDMPACEGNDDS